MAPRRRFSSTRIHRDLVTIGGVPARMAFAAGDRMAVVVPARPRWRRDAGEGRVAAGRHALRACRRMARHRPASSRQPGLRRRRQSLRHLQRHRAARKRRSRSSTSPRRRARAVRARPRQSHLDGAWSRWPALCVEPLRRPRLSRLRRWPLRGDGVGSRRGVRPGVRRRRRAVCRRSLRHDLPIDRKGRTETFASVPSSIAAFHLAMSPDGDLYVSAPTLASYDSVFRIDPEGRVETLNGAVRPAAGPRRSIASGRASRRGSAGRLERRLCDRAGSRSGAGRCRRRPGRPGLRSARRDGRRLERLGLFVPVAA